MKKYIRTKDGIYETTGKPNAISITNNVLYYCWDESGENEIIIIDDEIINQSDTIEELIQDGDMLYIHDLYPDVVLVVEGNIKPFGYSNAIKLKKWLELKFIEFDLYIKQSNEDYHKVAERRR